MTSLLRVKQERVRFYKFLTVGLIGAAIDFGVMNFLSHVFHSPLPLAGSISFFFALLNNFFWNRHWTYPDSRSRPVLKQLLMFLLVNLVGIAIRLPILHLLEHLFLKAFEKWSIFNSYSSFLAKNLTLGIAMGVVLLWNFFINRFWTYNDVDKVIE